MKINLQIRYVILFLVFCSISTYSQESKKYWVYFKDKGIFQSSENLNKSSEGYQLALSQLSERALKRRAKVLPPGQLIDAEDLPVNENYIQSVINVGGKLEQSIRWMNAASFSLTQSQILSVSQLPFVETIKPVARFVRREIQDIEKDNTSVFTKLTEFNYGPSLSQYAVVKVLEVHEIGISGDGVLIGMLDTGFRWKAHESLKNSKVIAERDFINNDNNTANETGDSPNQDSHGTLTMSIVGSYQPGQIIGPAFNAEFILGKTEYVPTETQIEEDWWAAGIEWMESRGVDVVSSSLGYDIFDNGQGYRWENGDFDGRTAVTTKAAARAARLGVVVATAMGNEGNGNGVKGTMICPADADSILSVGAIRIDGTLAGFSSTGPTNDGRIKPDIVTPGANVYSAVVPGPDTYTYSGGTSTATPIAAGVAAMLLSARPELTPVQVRDAIRNTADSVETIRYPVLPNNFVGWGKINALESITYYGPVFGKEPKISLIDSLYQVSINVASRYGIRNDKVIFNYSVNNVDQQPLTMYQKSVLHYPTSGVYSITIPAQQKNDVISFKIIAEDSSYLVYSSPHPITNKYWEFVYGDTLLLPDIKTFALLQNFPNPFNDQTTIRFNVPKQTEGELFVYNLLGQRVKLIYKGIFDIGSKDFYWNGTTDDGVNVSSGVYFIKIRTRDFSADRKILLLR